MKSHKTKNGELTGIIGVKIPRFVPYCITLPSIRSTSSRTSTFGPQYMDLDTPPEFSTMNAFTSTKPSRRRKAPTPEPIDPKTTIEPSRQAEFKPPTPPKTPTEVSKVMSLPAQSYGDFPVPPRKDSKETPNDLTALPSFQSPKNETVCQPNSPSDVSPKTKERLFIVPDDDLVLQIPGMEPRPSITSRVTSPNLPNDRAPLQTTLTHRPTIKSQKSSISLKMPSASPGPPPKGPLPDLPPVAREKELLETNRQLREHIDLLMEHLRYERELRSQIIPREQYSSCAGSNSSAQSIMH